MTTTQNDSISIILANRSYLYGLFQHIFGHEPSNELMEIVTGEHTKEALELIIDEEDPRFNDYFEIFASINKGMKENPEETLDRLSSEYTYLLIGPNKLVAPPWESVYINKERTIFQESTLKVRRAYLEYHFLPEKYPHEADDHIALELDFLGRLAQQAQDRFEAEDASEAKSLLEGQKRFLTNHLLLWVGDFANDIQESKKKMFYPAMARLVEDFVRIDAQVIDELLAVL